jgi:hypothetical protein
VRFRIFANKKLQAKEGLIVQIDKEDAVYNIQNNADLTEQEH